MREQQKVDMKTRWMDDIGHLAYTHNDISYVVNYYMWEILRTCDNM
jgi:hypothetical protein